MTALAEAPVIEPIRRTGDISTAPRSERLLRRLLAECSLPTHGRLLDIGCGNGVLLRTFSAIAPDWTLVTPQKGPIPREAILHAIASGLLTHDSMTKQVVRASVYGDMAVVTGRGSNTGTFRGAPISADEWITDVYRLVRGEWRCVLTHLAPAG